MVNKNIFPSKHKAFSSIIFIVINFIEPLNNDNSGILVTIYYKPKKNLN